MKFITALIFTAVFALVAAEDSDIAKILSKNDANSSTTAGTNDDSSSTTASSIGEQSTSESGLKGVKDQKDGSVCTRIYKPICGSNGKTYSNQCEFQNAHKLDSSLKLAKEGEC